MSKIRIHLVMCSWILGSILSPFLTLWNSCTTNAQVDQSPQLNHSGMTGPENDDVSESELLFLDTTLPGHQCQSRDTAGWPQHRSTAGPSNSTWLPPMPTSETTHSTLCLGAGIVLSRQSNSSNEKECIAN